MDLTKYYPVKCLLFFSLYVFFPGFEFAHTTRDSSLLLPLSLSLSLSLSLCTSPTYNLYTPWRRRTVHPTRRARGMPHIESLLASLISTTNQLSCQRHISPCLASFTMRLILLIGKRILVVSRLVAAQLFPGDGHAANERSATLAPNVFPPYINRAGAEHRARLAKYAAHNPALGPVESDITQPPIYKLFVGQMGASRLRLYAHCPAAGIRRNENNVTEDNGCSERASRIGRIRHDKAEFVAVGLPCWLENPGHGSCKGRRGRRRRRRG